MTILPLILALVTNAHAEDTNETETQETTSIDRDWDEKIWFGWLSLSRY